MCKGIGEYRAITLTTSADNIVGTSGNDTINAFIGAANSTLTGADVINGGAGSDTLSLSTDNTGGLSAATITNVEIFKIRDVGAGATYDFATVAGETAIINNLSTSNITLSNLAAGTALTIQGDGTTTNGNTTFTMAATTDAATINIDGGVKAGNITRNATGAATITVNSTGAANTIGTLDVDRGQGSHDQRRDEPDWLPRCRLRCVFQPDGDRRGYQSGPIWRGSLGQHHQG